MGKKCYFIMKKFFILMIVFVLGIVFMHMQVFAKEMIQEGACYVNDDHSDYDDESVIFTTKSNGVPYISFAIKSTSEEFQEDASIHMSLAKVTQNVTDEEDDLYDEDMITEVLENTDFELPYGEVGVLYWYHPNFLLTSGTYMLSFSSDDDNSYSIDYTIEYYDSIATTLTFPNSVSVAANKEKKLPIQYVEPQNALIAFECESSNEKVAELYWDMIENSYIICGYTPGKCTVSVLLPNNKKCNIPVTVTDGKPELKYTSCELCVGEKVQNKILYNKKSVKWKTSNSKIATVSKSGKIQGKKIGKCNITAKVDGKTLKCKVKVVYRIPNFGAYLYEYNTRNNCFVVKFKNWGDKPLLILADKARSMDKDYKTFDRKLQLSENKIKIAPGKSKTIKFKIKGSSTWPDTKSHTVEYYFSYDGKKYLGRTCYNDSIYKSGKKWYETYWDENKYSLWY